MAKTADPQCGWVYIAVDFFGPLTEIVDHHQIGFAAVDLRPGDEGAVPGRAETTVATKNVVLNGPDLSHLACLKIVELDLLWKRRHSRGQQCTIDVLRARVSRVELNEVNSFFSDSPKAWSD